MAQIYTFNTQLLSGAKSVTPIIATAYPLSANGVNVITLSSAAVGIAFNKIDTLASSLIDVTVEGNTFRIDMVYDGQQMALINNNTYTIFQFASAGSAGSAAVALSTNYLDVSDPNKRRLRHLGYNA